MTMEADKFPTFAFSERFSVLGPFQIGTREAVWGSDPLEALGGFQSLEYDGDATFRSSLAANGTVSWSNHTGKLADPNPFEAAIELDIGFQHIDWLGLRDIYGWAALQWQAWARGEIIVQSEDVEILTLQTPGILEFYIDDEHYFGGDFYSFQRAPVTLRLTPGIHRIDIRLVRDVRAMGGVGAPHVNINLALQKTSASLQPVILPQSGVPISDLIGTATNNKLASPYCSLLLRNAAEHDVEITSVIGPRNKCLAELLTPVVIVPGQSRPINFRLECIADAARIELEFQFRIKGDDTTRTLLATVTPELRDAREPHKVTFLSFTGVVSYAILRPPSRKAEESASSNASLPVFLALHGAGLEADSDDMRHSLDVVPDLAAWTLFPTGGTAWSGDDWHAWGLPDVETAIAMIPDWIERYDWKGTSANVERWIVAGHSNGGQGTWYTLLHRPDKVFAAAPISGYSSIQNYVPYTFWRPADPMRTAILQSALGSYRHEMLLPNAADIPVFQQYGGADDNVPPFHSRQMSQLIRQAGANSTYYEIQGKPHWWDGIFTTDLLKNFYDEQIARAMIDPGESSLNIPDFSLVTINPGDTGTKYGFRILQLAVPGQYGRIDVQVDPHKLSCSIRTSNVRMWHLPQYGTGCSHLVVDGQEIKVNAADHIGDIVLERDSTDQWQIQKDVMAETTTPILPPRHGRQLASMDAILRTQGAFQIIPHSPPTSHIALQISRNFFQYYAADTHITTSYTSALEATGNIISLSTDSSLPPSFYPNHPVSIHNSAISITRPDGSTKRYPNLPGLGLAAIFLRPLPLGRLELVVWGSDEKLLAVAARLVPLIPGTGQPDFVIMDRTMLWKGLEGALALGFLDYDWRISGNAFFS